MNQTCQTAINPCRTPLSFFAFPLSFHHERAQHPATMMKRALVFSSLAFSLAIARADLVLQQNIESPMINGTVTTQIKGDKIRVDMPSPQGAMSTIMDLNSGDSTTLMHQQKIAMKVPGAMVKQVAENMKKAHAGTTNSLQFTDTGKSETVAGYPSEVYTWSSSDGAKQTVWVAKSFPDYTKIKTQMEKLNDSPIAQMSKGSTPDVSKLPGMVVKTQTEMNGQSVTSTLISAKEQSVDASIFDTPKDYHEMTQPMARPPQNQ
jgi:hypothetical protein